MDIRQFFERYGLALVVVLGFALIAALLPGNAVNRSVDVGLGDFDEDFSAGGAQGDGFEGGEGADLDGAGGGAGTGGRGSSGGGGGTAGGGGGSTAGGGDVQQSGGGDAGEVVFGEGLCREDGRQAGITKYMPPCVNWTGTDNGGTTFQGVTRDKVLVVRWMGQIDPGTQAILESGRLADSRETIDRSYDVLRRYHNLHYETYGREVVFQTMDASGPSESDEAMKADALKIAKEIKPFAVIDGNPAAPVPNTLARELAQLGVLCMCTTSLSSEFYNELPPLLWSSLPTVNEYAAHIAEYVAKRVAGQKAIYAGDELNPAQLYREKERKFGLVYIEGARGRVDPEGRRARDIIVREFEKRGVKFSAEVAYIYDPGRNQQDVTNLVATMKNRGVTTIVGLWDPLYPILITQEATRQQYFPEWFITGTGLSDTTTAGRLYDQLQWRHAYGISPLWITWETVQRSAGYREYHHAAPEGAEEGDEGVLVNIYRARIQTLFRGIHMAGPNLTYETWIRGTLGYPKTGGLPALPLVFLTRQFPTEIKDFTEVWYDHDREGPDERSEHGTGMIMKVDGGKRYNAGEWPSSPPKVFVDEGAMAVSDNPPGGGDPEHEEDGHRHPPEQACMSCR